MKQRHFSALIRVLPVIVFFLFSLFIFGLATKPASAWYSGVYVSQFGTPDLWGPYFIAYSSGTDKYYVADTLNNRIRVYNSNGTFSFQFGSVGILNGQFTQPYAIGVDSATGKIYVGDTTNRIQIFDGAGVYQSTFGSTGVGNGQFGGAVSGMSIDSADNRLVVADPYNHRVQVFDLAGNFVTKFGTQGSGDGQLYYPVGTAIASNNDIYVADQINHRIEVFDSAGAYKSKFGTNGAGDGQFANPYDVEVDSAGNIYVADSNNHRVQVFNSNGTFNHKFGTQGSANGQFDQPTGLALNSTEGLAVVEVQNGRVQVFQTDATGPTGTISINSGDGYTASTASTLTLSATDVLTTVTNMMISESSGFVGASWEAYATSKAFTLSSGDGTKTVYIKYRDSYSNESGSYSDTIVLDATAPTGSVSIDGGTATTPDTSLDLTVSATDGGSGLAEMMISEDPDFVGASWEFYATSSSIVVSSGEGTKTVYIKFKDNSGQESGSYSDTIIYDLTDPTGAIGINSGDAFTNTHSAVLDLMAVDAGSGVTEMMISEDSGFVGASYEAYALTKAFTLSANDGVKTVYVKYKDVAANESISYSDTITVDTTITGSISINAGTTHTNNDDVILTLAAVSNGGGTITNHMVSESATFVGASWVAFDAAPAFTLSAGDGLKTVYVKYKDDAANESSAYSATITLDTVNPTVNITDLGLIDNVPDKTPLFYYFTSQTPHIKGVTQAGSTVHFTYDGEDYTTTADGSGKYDITIDNPELPRQYVELEYYSVDPATNQSSTRLLKLVIGVENFPVSASASADETPTEEVTPTPSVTPPAGEEPTEVPVVYEFLVTDQNGDPVANTNIYVDGQKYVSDKNGKVYFESKVSESAEVEVEFNGQRVKGSVMGEKIVVVKPDSAKNSPSGLLIGAALVGAVGLVAFFLLRKR